MPRRIAIVPARGGSKRIPNKNIRDFCGRPMLAHILQAAAESGLFDDIHISTDSHAVADTATALGFPPDFRRPADLAGDDTPLMPVLRHVLDEYAFRGKEFDQVWLLMPCAPLVSPDDLVLAEKMLAASAAGQTVVAVSDYPAPIEWAFRRTHDSLLEAVSPGMFAVRSQDLKKKYFDAGAFCGFMAETVRNSQGAGSDAGLLGYVLPKWKAVDIDEEDDWAFAEMIFRGVGKS